VRLPWPSRRLLIAACIVAVAAALTAIELTRPPTSAPTQSTPGAVPSRGRGWLVLLSGEGARVYACLTEGDYLYACGCARAPGKRVRAFVVKVDLKRGEVAWCKAVSGFEGSAFKLIKRGDDLIVCGAWELKGFICCLSDDGQLRWGYLCDAPLHGLLDLGDSVLAYSSDGVLVSLKLSGEAVYQVKLLVEGADGVWRSPWLHCLRFAGGRFYAAGSCDRLVSEGSGSDLFLACLEFPSRVLWSEAIGTSSDDRLQVVLCSNESLYACGWTWCPTFGEADILVARLSLSGELEWVRVVGGRRWESVLAACLVDGRVRMLGFTYSFAPAQEVLVVELDEGGRALRSWTIGVAALRGEAGRRVSWTEMRWGAFKAEERQLVSKEVEVEVSRPRVKVVEVGVLHAARLALVDLAELPLSIAAMHPESLSLLQLRTVRG